MGISPETKLIQKIHRQTDKYKDKDNKNLIFKQKMNMMPGGISGIPDYYYEAKSNMLWVEYKAIPKWEGKRTIPINKVTTHQMTWLERSIANGRNCAVIIGDAKGKCLILSNDDIVDPPDISQIELKTPTEVAVWVATMVMRANYKELI